jgi:hypothetical protein
MSIILKRDSGTDTKSISMIGFECFDIGQNAGPGAWVEAGDAQYVRPAECRHHIGIFFCAHLLGLAYK